MYHISIILLLKNNLATHCVKSVRIRSYSGPYFPASGLNTERFGVSLRIRSECGKIRTRRTPNTDNFYAVNICSLIINISGRYEWFILVRDHPFSTCATFSKKLTFLTRRCPHHGVRNISFSENFAQILQ